MLAKHQAIGCPQPNGLITSRMSINSLLWSFLSSYSSNFLVETHAFNPRVRVMEGDFISQLRVVVTDQRVIIEKALFSCPATYRDSFGKLFTIALSSE